MDIPASQNVWDLILYFYAKPIAMNIKLKTQDKIKYILFYVLNDDYGAICHRIGVAFHFDLHTKIKCIQYNFGDFTKSNFNSFGWSNTDIFVVETYQIDDLAQVSKHEKVIDETSELEDVALDVAAPSIKLLWRRSESPRGGQANVWKERFQLKRKLADTLQGYIYLAYDLQNKHKKVVVKETYKGLVDACIHNEIHILTYLSKQP
eukprot:731840_1